MFMCESTEPDSFVRNDGFDFTFSLEPFFTDLEKTLISARLGFIDQEGAANLTIEVGFRSSIQLPLDRTVMDDSPFLLTDLFGLVPGAAIIAYHRNRGLVGSAIAREISARLLLILKGKSSQKESVGEVLDKLVIRISRMWSEWSQVLLRVLTHDTILNNLGIDIREFLAVSSGYGMMSWYRSYTQDEIEIVTHRIISVCNSFFSSVLSQKQMDDPIVRTIIGWLEGLHEKGINLQMPSIKSPHIAT